MREEIGSYLQNMMDDFKKREVRSGMEREKKDNMKFYMIDTRVRNLYDQMKEYTIEELKEYFTINDGEISNVDRIAEIKDIYDLVDFLEEEAEGMEIPYHFIEVKE